MNLKDALSLYTESGFYPFHMPGHKRNPLFCPGYSYGIDITEISGFDNKHDPKGILKAEMKKASKLYGAKHSFFLINGSTCGILAGICSCTQRGDKILVARNSHRSVYNAIYMQGLVPVWLIPPSDIAGIAGSITPSMVEDALEKDRDIKLVVLTSPTYEGVISDIKGILDITRSRGVVLLVDEAHGSHLGLGKMFCTNSVQLGADIVVHGLHKTLPSPTQTALLHINGDIVSIDKVAKYLGVFESSSPSYIMMTGISECINLLQNKGDRLFFDYESRLTEFFDNMSELQNLRIIREGDLEHAFLHDPGKIVIYTGNTDITGPELMRMLADRYLLVLEMALGDYALAMTSICDTKKGFDRLGTALLEIDSRLSLTDKSVELQSLPYPECNILPADTEGVKGDFVTFVESEGRVCLEFLYAYPPSVPIIAPGEVIKREHIDFVSGSEKTGVETNSSKGQMPERIYVAKNHCNP